MQAELYVSPETRKKVLDLLWRIYVRQQREKFSQHINSGNEKKMQQKQPTSVTKRVVG
jgi:hypothetical protein